MTDETPPEDEAPDQERENVVRVDFKRGRVADVAGPAADDKLKAFRELAARGMVMVTLDARRPGVVVPQRFASDSQLNLNFSHRFGVADFIYDTVGVRGTLSFGGHPFFCEVPWGAVWALRSHVDNPDHVLVWHDALPAELLSMLPPAAREQLELAQKRRDEEAPSSRPTPQLASEEPPSAEPKARGVLRLVKPDEP